MPRKLLFGRNKLMLLIKLKYTILFFEKSKNSAHCSLPGSVIDSIFQISHLMVWASACYADSCKSIWPVRINSSAFKTRLDTISILRDMLIILLVRLTPQFFGLDKERWYLGI